MLVEKTNFSFYTILIRLEIAELAKASYSYPQLAADNGEPVWNTLDHLIFVKLACIPNFIFLDYVEVTFPGGWVGVWVA